MVRELQSEGAVVQRDVNQAIAKSEYLAICLPAHESIYASFEAIP